jgi:hypothetical protein
MRELPVLTEPSEDEKRICQLQNGFVTRLRRSQYYIIEPTKTNGERSLPPKAPRKLMVFRTGTTFG